MDSRSMQNSSLFYFFHLLLRGRNHIVSEQREQIIDVGVLMCGEHPVIFFAQVNEHTEFTLTAEQQRLRGHGEVWNEFHSLEWTH